MQELTCHQQVGWGGCWRCGGWAEGYIGAFGSWEREDWVADVALAKHAEVVAPIPCMELVRVAGWVCVAMCHLQVSNSPVWEEIAGSGLVISYRVVCCAGRCRRDWCCGGILL